MARKDVAFYNNPAATGRNGELSFRATLKCFSQNSETEQYTVNLVPGAKITFGTDSNKESLLFIYAMRKARWTRAQETEPWTLEWQVTPIASRRYFFKSFTVTLIKSASSRSVMVTEAATPLLV